MRSLIVTAAALAIPSAALATFTAAKLDFDGGDIAVTGTSNNLVIQDDDANVGDMFGVRSRLTTNSFGDGLPFSMSDDSVTPAAGNTQFASDTRAVIGQAKTDNFFGETDADGMTNLPARQTWSFDLGSPTELVSLSIDIGAFATGFEPDDVYTFFINADGSGEVIAMEFNGVDAPGFTYRAMDSGAVPTEDDDRPLGFSTALDTGNSQLGQFVNKADPLTGDLDTYTVDLSSLGNVTTFDLTFQRAGDFSSSNESFAFDNVVVTGIPEPATLSLIALGGLALARRRRA